MENFEYKEVPMNKRPYYGTKKWNINKGKNIFRHLGSLKKVNRRVERFPFTGHVTFYADNSKKNKTDWKEYQACFLKGKLIHINIVRIYWPNLFLGGDFGDYVFRTFEEDGPYSSCV